MYKAKKKYKYIICVNNEGPCFGDKENNKIFKISNNYYNKKSYFNKSSEYYLDDQDKELFIDEEPEFIVKKLEIIKILN